MREPDHASPAVLIDGDRVLLLGGKQPDGAVSDAVWSLRDGEWRLLPALPIALGWPRAWCCPDRGEIVVAGSTERSRCLVRLDRATLALREVQPFSWPNTNALHVDCDGTVWAFGEPPAVPGVAPPLGAVLAAEAPEYPAFLSLPDGGLLSWPSGGADVHRPQGVRLLRLDRAERAWTPVGVVPTGHTGLVGGAIARSATEIVLLTTHGDLLRFDPTTGAARLAARLDDDKANAFWGGACLAPLGPDRVIVCRAEVARMVDLRTGEVEPLAPPARPRVGGSAVPDGDEHVWLVGGFDRSRAGVPPERYRIERGEPAPLPRPAGIRILFPSVPRALPEVGDPVRLSGGRYASLSGTVRSVDSLGQKATVEIALFGRTLTVVVALSEIAPAGG